MIDNQVQIHQKLLSYFFPPVFKESLTDQELENSKELFTLVCDFVFDNMKKGVSAQDLCELFVSIHNLRLKDDRLVSKKALVNIFSKFDFFRDLDIYLLEDACNSAVSSLQPVNSDIRIIEKEDGSKGWSPGAHNRGSSSVVIDSIREILQYSKENSGSKQNLRPLKPQRLSEES